MGRCGVRLGVERDGREKLSFKVCGQKGVFWIDNERLDDLVELKNEGGEWCESTLIPIQKNEKSDLKVRTTKNWLFLYNKKSQ